MFFWSSIDKTQQPRDVSRRSRPSQVEIGRNGAEQARTPSARRGESLPASTVLAFLSRSSDPLFPRSRTRLELSPPQLTSRCWPVDLCKEMANVFRKFLENNMNTKLSIVLVACVGLLVSSCGSSPQSLILGKWEAASAKVAGADAGPEVGSAINVIKMTAEFKGDGTARITMFGQTRQGNYKLNGGNELEWTMNGITTKSKVNVTATELELTDDANRTIKYKRSE
jgi:hypothetical protein